VKVGDLVEYRGGKYTASTRPRPLPRGVHVIGVVVEVQPKEGHLSESIWVQWENGDREINFSTTIRVIKT